MSPEVSAPLLPVGQMVFALQLFGRKRNWKLGCPNQPKAWCFWITKGYYHGLDVCVPPEFICYGSSCQCDGVEEAFWRWLCVSGQWGWGPHNGFGALVEEKAALVFSSGAKKGTRIKNQVSLFSFLNSRITVCCLSTPCMGFCQSSLSLHGSLPVLQNSLLLIL